MVSFFPGKGGGLEADDEDVPEDEDDLRVALPPTNNDDTKPSTKVFFFKKTLPAPPPLRIVFISLWCFCFKNEENGRLKMHLRDLFTVRKKCKKYYLT